MNKKNLSKQMELHSLSCSSFCSVGGGTWKSGFRKEKFMRHVRALSSQKFRRTKQYQRFFLFLFLKTFFTNLTQFLLRRQNKQSKLFSHFFSAENILDEKTTFADKIDLLTAQQSPIADRSLSNKCFGAL